MNQMLTYAMAGLAARLGSFERGLLLAVDRAGGDAYCAELARRLSVERGREVSMGQTSRTLAALKGMGLLTSEQVLPPSPQKNQRSRLVYSVTQEGKRVVDALEQKRMDQHTAGSGLAHA